MNGLSSNNKKIIIKIPNNLQGKRLDIAINTLLPEYSRSKISSLINNKKILVDEKEEKNKKKVIGGEIITIDLQDEISITKDISENIALNIIFEDDDIIVINKPTNFIVHPGAGNHNGTLLNALLYHEPKLKNIPRAGIVHRLDKDTTGLLVVAKNIISQTSLVKQLQNRTITRKYLTIVHGIVPYDGKIETLIGRDPYNRTKMAVVKHGGKIAITNIKVIEYFNNYTLIECSLETGRTHQIRVHMQEANFPIVGDKIYKYKKIEKDETIKNAIKNLNRQALHAYQLTLNHPKTNEIKTFKANLPNDMEYLLNILRKDII